jgi:ribulose-phosphate 3-epimerase
VDVLLVMGTPLGVKGYDLDPRTPAVVRRLRTLVDRDGLSTVIQVDGGIRDHVVPGLLAAGADGLTPGSLFFRSDHAALRDWIDGLAADRRADEGADLAAR